MGDKNKGDVVAAAIPAARIACQFAISSPMRTMVHQKQYLGSLTIARAIATVDVGLLTFR